MISVSFHFLLFLTWSSTFFHFYLCLAFCSPIDFSHYFMYPLTFFLNRLFWERINLFYFLHYFEKSTTYILYFFNVIQELGNVNLIICSIPLYSLKHLAAKLKFQVVSAQSRYCHYLGVHHGGRPTTRWPLFCPIAMGVWT